MQLTCIIRAGEGIGSGFTSVTLPRISPDGNKVVFVADTGIWVLNLETNDLTHVSDSLLATWPNWSPDNSKIVFGAAPGIYGYEVYIVNANGTGQTLLAPALVDGTTTSFPSFAPDGTVIYTKAIPDGLGNFPGTLWTINANGSGDTLFFTPPGPDEDSPYASQARWSHDGNLVLYQRSNTDVDDGGYTLNNSGGDDTKIAENFGTGQDWNADDSKILISSIDSSVGLYTIDPDGSNQDLLYDAIGLVLVSNPSYGPDNTPICFSGEQVDEFFNKQIWLLESGGADIGNATINCVNLHLTVTGAHFGAEEGTLVVFDPNGDPVEVVIDEWDDNIIIAILDIDPFLNGVYQISVNGSEPLNATLLCNIIGPGAGLYELTKTAKHDSIYNVDFDLIDTKIPDPFVVTSFLGDE